MRRRRTVRKPDQEWAEFLAATRIKWGRIETELGHRVTSAMADECGAWGDIADTSAMIKERMT